MRGLDIGELVQMYSNSAPDLENLAKRDLFTGLYMGWDYSDDGWNVLINGKLETFASTWWKCRRVT